MSANPFTHVVGHTFRHAKHMPKVGEGKNPVVAFFVGLLFGPFGIGIYLQSWGDFFVLMGLLVMGSIMSAGLGAPVFWMLCGAWGAVRVHNSNAK